MLKKVFLIVLLLIPNLAFSKGIDKSDNVARQSVDLVEVNHFYDEQGSLVFDQDLFYNWNDIDARYDVLAWRLIKSPNQIPQRDWQNGGYSCFWKDGEQIRHINAKAFKETWTQYDPELLEREILPKERRKELLTVKFTKPAKQPTPPTPVNPCPNPTAKDDD